MFFLKFTVSGLETIDEDFNSEMKKIQGGIPQALQYVGSEMIVNLQKHIFKDWYKKYKPAEYQRRTDDISLGTPLGGEANMDVSVNKDKLEFTYEPTGEHANEIWNTREGDDLIEFLQVGWDGIPARPVWNNFVREQLNEGIMKSFIKGMSPYVKVIPEGIEKDVVFDENESMLEENSSMELPF